MDTQSYVDVNTTSRGQKADMGKRVVAVLIDSVAVTIVAFVLSKISGLNILGLLFSTAYTLTRDGFDFDFMDKRSLGKKLMKIRPVRLDGKPMDLTTSLARNWTLLIGIVPVIGFFMAMNDPQGKRIGDKFADTMVISDE